LQYVPRVIVTDKLRSYGVARRRLLPGVEHRQSRYLTDIFDKFFFPFGAIVVGHG
jgi:transposase-like protein